MFDVLTQKLEGIFKRLRGRGKLTERDVDEALREVRIALLEADVNFKVVRDFINKVREKATGQQVLESLTPAQQVIKIVNSELVDLMGGGQSKLELAPSPPTVVMMVGLQGSGKTTTCAKLGNLLRQQGHNPVLVACDVTRPAAVKQLAILGENLSLGIIEPNPGEKPVEIALRAREEAVRRGYDVVIIDTAGRLHVDDEMMAELEEMKARVHPHSVLLVADAMMGQDAVNVASTFASRLGIDGVILTKLDGDARGGAALSIKAVTGCPIKFVGVGEKTDALEPFHPDRMASRILGMGDVLSLIEKAEATMSAEEAKKLAQKVRSKEFTLEDFLEQMRQVRKMGPLEDLLAMLPGFGRNKALRNLKVDEKQFVKIEAIINSMTREERRNVAIIDGSRRKRIARGSGTQISDVNALLKQFEQVRKMLRHIGDLEKTTRGGGQFGLPFLR